MDFENLENMDKNEFVALGTTVKQEMVDNGIVEDSLPETMAETPAGSNEINSATAASNTADATEPINPVCDSAEKQVNQIFSSSNIKMRRKLCCKFEQNF